MDATKMSIVIMSLFLLITSTVSATVTFPSCECSSARIHIPNIIIMGMAIVSLVLCVCGCSFEGVDAGHALTTIAPALLATIGAGYMLFGKGKCGGCDDEDDALKFSDFNPTQWSWRETNCCPKKNAYLWAQFLIALVALGVSLKWNKNFTDGFEAGTEKLGKGFKGARTGATKAGEVVAKNAEVLRQRLKGLRTTQQAPVAPFAVDI